MVVDQFFAGQLRQAWIDFDRDQVRDLRRDKCGKRAGAGADFEHHVVVRKLRRIDKDVLQVEIDQEILPVARVQAQADFFEAVLEKGEGLVGHGRAQMSSEA